MNNFVSVVEFPWGQMAGYTPAMQANDELGLSHFKILVPTNYHCNSSSVSTQLLGNSVSEWSLQWAQAHGEQMSPAGHGCGTMWDVKHPSECTAQLLLIFMLKSPGDPQIMCSWECNTSIFRDWEFQVNNFNFLHLSQKVNCNKFLKSQDILDEEKMQWKENAWCSKKWQKQSTRWAPESIKSNSFILQIRKLAHGNQLICSRDTHLPSSKARTRTKVSRYLLNDWLLVYINISQASLLF